MLRGIENRLGSGKGPTAAQQRFLAERKARRGASRSASPSRGGKRGHAQPGAAVPHGGESVNYGATLEEDLEEWVLRDGVVRGVHRRLSVVLGLHQVKGAEGERALWRVQRRLLTEYGFEGAKRSGPLEGAEALAMQWVKSIGQLARVSAEWELQMEDVSRARLDGKGVDMEWFAAMVGTLKALVEKRDGLALKVRELSVKERRASVGKGKRASVVEIVMQG
jgi:hypothetical protein